MPNIIALLLCFACGTAAAAEVSLVGVIGGKAAVVVLDGGNPKTVKVGQTWNGITVVSVDKDSAVMEIEGARRTLQQGQHYRRAAATPDRAQATLAAGPGGQFVGEGMVNGTPVRFLVDTGASSIALPASLAQRAGIDFRKGEPGLSNTANGLVPVYRVSLATVRLGEIELSSVDAVVFEAGLDTALLGMSFLNRVDMRREGETMTLTKRF
ncbi:MAG TPA: TIGR02281 family clan AA aspartic protease [Burkholderiales bacterium]|jgi:aspartyl protease family protein|nr:TIGR02281 family clan AA aspartic protease [Burkholderiales bacterium]HXJ51292.1 TIGR02281 family clan AA aspartic protease [Burkholderiales bacterium]